MEIEPEEEGSFELPSWWNKKSERMLRTFACIHCGDEKSYHMAEKPPGETQRHQHHCHKCRKITPHKEIA